MDMIPLLKEDVTWCLARLPRPVVKLLRDNPIKVFLAGGFVRDCILREKPSDVDLFAASPEEAFAAARTLALSDEKPGAITVGWEKRIHRSDNAFTLHMRHTVQIIHRWTFDSPRAALESFDFTIARGAVWYDGKEFTGGCDPRFYPDLAAKRLIYCAPDRNEDAGGSLLRLLKFYQRGYRAPLHSVGGVIARLMAGVNFDAIPGAHGRLMFEDALAQRELARVLTGLLHEVDPLLDPEALARNSAVADAPPIEEEEL